MKRLLFNLLLCYFATSAFAQGNYDLVIVGGTPGGIMTAIAAAREGKTSVLLERTNYYGGLPANGLGATDIFTRGATTGLFKEFVDRVQTHYINKYGQDSQQVRDCNSGYYFEASVASLVFTQMLNEHRDKITVLKMRQFDSEPRNVDMKNDAIVAIRILNRETKQIETYTGKVFVDATYEGDLGAAAKAPFRVGREGRDEFNEIGAGKVYKYWEGPEQDCSTFQGDNALQAYNYRLCLTNIPENRVLPQKPENYNRQEYVSLIEDVWTGLHTGAQMMNVTSEMMEANRQHIAQGNPTQIPGDPWGIAKITNMVKLPNGKTDANNQHLAFISTNLPQENWPWPTSGWDWRDRYAQRLREYITGLVWFVQNDSQLPEHFRKECLEWGFAKDEYIDNDNFPRQVYVREGRRFEGEYFFTANDALPVSPGQRPPLHSASVTASHYALDSHSVRKREPGKIHLDGFLSYNTAVYTVPFGVIVPKGVDNLLIPVPVSGSHIGFSTLRMEPCWMALGQAAGIAASLSIDYQTKIKNVPVKILQDKLVKQKATVYYFRDITVNSPDFEMVQHMGLLGYLPEWEAKLDEPVDVKTAALWSGLSGKRIETGVRRKETLQEIYRELQK